MERFVCIYYGSLKLKPFSFSLSLFGLAIKASQFSGSHQTYFIKSVIMKIFSCLSWMEHLYDQVFELFVGHAPVDRDLPYGIMVPNTVTDRELPYELIVDILSRLPAECVAPCVHACKPLLDLTRTQSFVDLHLKRASPVIAFQYFVLEERGIKKYAREVSVTFTDKTLQKVANSKTITVDLSLGIHKKECRPTLYGSYDGFLMFKNITYDPVLFLWNPATQEQVTITAPHDGYHACGLFFHPTSKEYRALFVSSMKGGTLFEYSILSLKTKRSRLVTMSKYRPSGTLPPAIVNGKLHWLIWDKSYNAANGEPRCTHSIVVFDMESEKVSTMGHPGISCQTLYYRVHRMMKLMEKGGKLWFVNDMKAYGKISMWVLEDYKRRIWVRMPDIELKKPSTLFCLPGCVCKKHEYPEALHIFKNEVLIRVFYQDLYLYSLQGGDENEKMRRVEMQFNGSGLPLAAVAHVGTLLSLRTDKLLFLFKNKTR